MAPQFGRSRLPELLAQARLKQTDFAKRMKLSDTMVSRIISGEKRLSLLRAKQASDILDCQIDDLYEWIYDESPADGGWWKHPPFQPVFTYG